jgi:hypothetical protein
MDPHTGMEITIPEQVPIPMRGWFSNQPIPEQSLCPYRDLGKNPHMVNVSIWGFP